MKQQNDDDKKNIKIRTIDLIIKSKKLIEKRMKNDIDLVHATMCLNMVIDLLEKGI